jgi:hypothetical protein
MSKKGKLLLHDIERHFLPMPRGSAREQSANRTNGLSVTPDNAPDVRLPHLQAEDRHPAARDFREHDLIRKFNELADDKLEELSHASDLSDVSVRCPTTLPEPIPRRS